MVVDVDVDVVVVVDVVLVVVVLMVDEMVEVGGRVVVVVGAGVVGGDVGGFVGGGGVGGGGVGGGGVGGGVVGGGVVGASVVVVVVVELVVVGDGGLVASGESVGASAGGRVHGEVNTIGRYRHGLGQASRNMLRALFDIETTTSPFASRQGIAWAWYVFILGSSLRGPIGRSSTVVHGPHGSSATSNEYASPQYPSIAATATQTPSIRRGCIGNSAQWRSRIGSDSAGFSLQPSAVRYSGSSNTCPLGTRARNIFVPECGPLKYPPSRARFCSKVLPNR